MTLLERVGVNEIGKEENRMCMCHTKDNHIKYGIDSVDLIFTHNSTFMKQ